MCFTLEWLEHLLILAVVIIAIVAILQIIISYVLTKVPAGMFADAISVVSQVIKIVIWAIVIIAVIYFVFAMISCLWSYAGGISLMPHGR